MRKNIVVLSSFIALSSLIGCQKAPTSITIVGPSLILTSEEKKESYKYTATINPNNAVKDVIWTIDDSSKASIDANTGLLSNITEGTFTITATSKKDGKISDSLEITAFKGQTITETEYCTTYDTRYKNLKKDLTPAGEKVKKCKFEKDDYFLTTDLTDIEGKYILNADDVIELDFTEESETIIYTVEELKVYFQGVKDIIDPEHGVEGTLDFALLDNGDLYYFVYIKYEEDGITKYSIHLLGMDKKGYLIREVEYSDYLAEERGLESPYIINMHPSLIQ